MNEESREGYKGRAAEDEENREGKDERERLGEEERGRRDWKGVGKSVTNRRHPYLSVALIGSLITFISRVPRPTLTWQG